MNYRYLLLDWDGTLADTINIWLKAYSQLLHDKYHIAATNEIILKQLYGNPKGVESLGIENYKKFNNELFELVQNNYHFAPLFPTVKDTLVRLKRKNIVMAIITNTKKEMIFKALKYHQIRELFSLIIGREDVLNLKPNPEAIEMVTKRLNWQKSQSLIVGDSDNDIIAGKKSHIDTALYLPLKNGQSFQNQFKYLSGLAPNFLITSHDELLTLTAN